MRKSVKSLVALLAVFLGGSSLARADSVLEFALQRSGNESATEHRQALIKNGRLYTKGVDGASHKDLMYDRMAHTFWLIDHSQRSYYQLDEQSLLQWSAQGRALMGAAQSLARQFNIELPDELQGSGAAEAALTYVANGEQRINAIPCRRYDVVDGRRKTGELCMADRGGLAIPADDYQTLLSLKEFLVKASNESAEILASLGIQLPRLGTSGMPGIPIEIASDAVGDFRRVQLNRVSSEPVPAAPDIPPGYTASALPLPRLP